MDEERITASPFRLTPGYYCRTLADIVGAPGRFFSRLPEPVGFRRSIGFLLFSCLFFAGASFLCFRPSSFLLTGILFVNALFMPFIASGIGFMAMAMILGKRIPFERLFAIVAFSWGVTLMASWIPFSLWVTEPWKWSLIAVGMVKGGGLRWGQTILLLALTIGILVLFFRSLLPLIGHLRGFGG